jgi:predicted 3-demethylubiquinone-9 3-methyltransferase (glyoxalase superfamily)
MQKITPFLWFNGNAEAAVKFYRSVFKDSKILQTTRYSESSANAAGQPKGAVMTIAFELNGVKFMGLNGGPEFKFNEAISFMVNCRTQREIDHYWKKLSAGGKEIQCGWLKDKFGVAWQIVPAILPELMSDKIKTERVMQEVIKMKKLDIATLKRAARGK